MKPILFVTEDSALLEGLRQGLRHKRLDWRMDFVSTGKSAIGRFTNGSPVEVLVTDVSVLASEGKSLVRWVAETYPNTTRIVISTPAYKSETLQAMPYATHILDKPDTVAELSELIEETLTDREAQESSQTVQFTDAFQQIQPMPQTFKLVCDLLNDPNSTLDQLGRVIMHEPAIAARLLQVANSAYFGGGSKIVSVSGAIAFLGHDIVRSIVLSENLFPSTETNPYVASFRWVSARSLTGANFAMGCLENRDLASEAFSACLLMDVGLLVLAKIRPEPLRRCIREASNSGRPLFEVELEINGATHADIGAHLLAKWQLPSSIVEAVALHHRPAKPKQANLDVVVATHVAASMVESLVGAAGIGGNLDLSTMLDSNFITENGYADKVERWLAQSEKELAA
jgi:HD-like signal output (HDOD) protein